MSPSGKGPFPFDLASILAKKIQKSNGIWRVHQHDASVQSSVFVWNTGHDQAFFAGQENAVHAANQMFD
jgi:hypothetical protein